MLVDPSLLVEDIAEELPFEFETYEDEVAFKEQLRLWHEEYGSIYSTEINDIIFFFRALTRKELAIAKNVYKDDYERTEYICKTCVVEPEIEEYSLEIFAGIPEMLCVEILAESVFSDPMKVKMMIAKWEKELESVENQLPLVIKEAFPDLSLEEIEGWPMGKVAEYYVKARWLLENIRGLQLVSNSEADG